jgi:hypothetical protein
MIGSLQKQTVNKAKTLIKCDFEGGGSHLYFWCPGCKGFNFYNVGKPNSGGHNWDFNGDFEKPTFTPSLRYVGGPTGSLCHLFVTAGKIAYCTDCPHEYNGKTIDLPIIDAETFAYHLWHNFPTEWL